MEGRTQREKGESCQQQPSPLHPFSPHLGTEGLVHRHPAGCEGWVEGPTQYRKHPSQNPLKKGFEGGSEVEFLSHALHPHEEEEEAPSQQKAQKDSQGDPQNSQQEALGEEDGKDLGTGGPHRPEDAYLTDSLPHGDEHGVEHQEETNNQ